MFNCVLDNDEERAREEELIGVREDNTESDYICNHCDCIWNVDEE